MSFIGMNNKCKDCPKCTESAINGGNCIGSWNEKCENFAPPKRIQRKRTRGWRMPENTVYVGRPTKWGNPFTGSDALKWYKEMMEGITSLKYGDTMFFNGFEFTVEDLKQIRGKNLACWCPLDKPCHADILLQIVNKEIQND